MKIHTAIASLLAVFSFSSAQASPWKWRYVTDKSIPSNANYYGLDTNRALVCGVYNKKEWSVGKIYRDSCLYTWGGESHAASKYFVLLGEQIKWFPYNSSEEPLSFALYLGSDATNRSYVCGVNYRNEYNVGKVYLNQCHISWGGKVLKFDNFEIAASTPEI